MKRKLNLTLTGFNAYHGVEQNSSAQVVHYLEEQKSLDSLFKLSTHIFPVEYQENTNSIENIVRKTNPDLLLLTGMHSITNNIHLEKYAKNLNNSTTPDNNGVVHNMKPIMDNLPDEFASSLPLEHFASLLNLYGIPTIESIDAGGFVCNNHYYLAKVLQKKLNNSFRCLFVHIPNPLNNGCTISIPEIAKGIKLIAKLIAEC